MGHATSFIARVKFAAIAAAAGFACAAAAASPAAAFHLPLRIDTRLSLSAQFGYAPDYPLNVPSFDAGNRPAVRSRGASQHVTGSAVLFAGDAWVRVSLLAAIRTAHPGFTHTVNGGGWTSERIEFDSRGRAYTLIEIRVRSGSRYNLLLSSLDGGVTWTATTLPFGGKHAVYDGRDNGTAAMEQYAGRNANSTPPLVAVWRPVADHPGAWASRNELYVLKPYYAGRRLVLPRPALVSRRYVGQCYAAGGASFAVSTASRAYIVWPELSRGGQLGTPTFVGAYDFVTRRVISRRLVALAQPRDDAHDAPGIVRDGKGILHVLTGAHNAPFLYAHSLRPLDVRSWTRPVPVLRGGYVSSGGERSARQTYLSLACLPDDSLVIVYRQARCGVDAAFGSRGYHALCVQRRSPSGVWSVAHRLVCRADRAGYANYFQKLTVDRVGRLYLSLSYFSPRDYPPDRREANRYHHRMVLISKDGGAGWDFATGADFAEGMALAAQ